MTKVKITINPKDGTIRYEIEGMPGTGCKDLTNALASANQVKDEGYTSEYVQPADVPVYGN